jgi:hypothetical protein
VLASTAPSLGAPSSVALALVGLFLSAPAAWSQCPAGTVTVVADRDNTLYEDNSGTLSNGAGDHLFVGETGAGRVVRGLVHFDVAAALPPGSVIGAASFLMTLDQPNDHGMHAIRLHRALADWGEGTSFAGGGEGRGGSATTGDATWLHTFFNASTWASAGGDFEAVASAETVVDSGGGGRFTWSSMQMSLDAQAWLDSPATNYGWLLRGTEGAGTTSIRFTSRANSGTEPLLCLDLCPGAGPQCPMIFGDGFESGDTTAWGSTVP